MIRPYLNIFFVCVDLLDCFWEIFTLKCVLYPFWWFIKREFWINFLNVVSDKCVKSVKRRWNSCRSDSSWSHTLILFMILLFLASIWRDWLQGDSSHYRKLIWKAFSGLSFQALWSRHQRAEIVWVGFGAGTRAEVSNHIRCFTILQI